MNCCRPARHLAALSATFLSVRNYDISIGERHVWCVLSVALSLALGAFSATLPVAFVISGAAVATCFYPEEDCTAFAVDAIDRAERQILMNAYALTAGSGIVEALIRAKQRNVDVELIADKTSPCGRGNGIEPLARAGVPIWIDRGVRIAHAKAMVIDRKVVLTGSMNFTNGAAQNSENLTLISSEPVVASFARHWQERLVVSVPFTRREEWCRTSVEQPCRPRRMRAFRCRLFAGGRRIRTSSPWIRSRHFYTAPASQLLFGELAERVRH